VSRERIIYVTGMKPKPAPELHRPELTRVLRASLARIDPAAAEWLDARPENFTLVSWTSLFYPAPADIAADLEGVERLLANPEPTLRDRREAAELKRELLRAWHLIGDSFPWLSRLVTPPPLKATLAEVRQYLGNENGIGVRIRDRLIVELEAAWAAGERVLLIGHSLGSVIAYDSLWHLTHQTACRGQVDLFMTLGSPLATRFIRKGLQGAGLGGAKRYPGNITDWVNVSARGEMVALHRRLRPFFAGMLKLGLVRSIRDVTGICNHFRVAGQLNVHKSYGYLNHPAVASRIAGWLSR